MFSWVGAQFDAVLNSYVLSVVSALMHGIAPIALSAMTIWIALYGWAVLRNEVSDSVGSFVFKVTKIGVILAIGLQSGWYISEVSDTANALSTGVASTFLTTTADPATLSSPYAILDAFNDKASQLVSDLMREASIMRLDLVLAAVTTAFGNVIFLCIALLVITLAKVVLTFVIAVGPLFILCLAWKPTSRFFDSWLSMLLNAVVLSWFAFFALGLSAHIGESLVKVIRDQGGLAGPTFNAVDEAFKYCIVMILMALICSQAPGLAAALTGGSPVQHGMQMIQNAMMISGLRSASASQAAGPAGAAGGVVRAGTGPAHAAGRAAGVFAMVAGRVAQRSFDTTRTPAYKLAAMRGLAH